MGRWTYWHRREAALACRVTGRCEPRHVALGHVSRGEHSGRARRTDPPSGGPFPFRGRTVARGRRETVGTLGGRVVKRIVLASPRGYCAGVERAIDTVEEALALWGPPIYVRRQIVHNTHVMRDLERRGAVFVESEDEVPAGERVVFSAHGVAPSVHENAQRAGLETIDATCPLVTKVHAEARHFAARGYTIFLIGHARTRRGRRHAGRGARGDRARRVASRMPRAPGRRRPPARLHHADDPVGRRHGGDRRGAAPALPRRSRARRRRTSATRRRTASAPSRRCCGEIDLLLVIGSRNSSNSNRLVDVARAAGVDAHLIDDERRSTRRGSTASRPSASPRARPRPRRLVRSVVAWFRASGCRGDPLAAARTRERELQAPARGTRPGRGVTAARGRHDAPSRSRRSYAFSIVSSADVDPGRERLGLDPVSVLEEVAVLRKRDDDAVGDLETRVLAEPLDRVDQVVTRPSSSSSGSRRGVERDRQAVVLGQRPALGRGPFDEDLLSASSCPSTDTPARRAAARSDRRRAPAGRSEAPSRASARAAVGSAWRAPTRPRSGRTRPPSRGARRAISSTCASAPAPAPSTTSRRSG